jgi:hypothetical protein
MYVMGGARSREGGGREGAGSREGQGATREQGGSMEGAGRGSI